MASYISAWYTINMETIVSVEEILSLSEKLHHQKKKIVLVGGCFDILHVGHIQFLDAAKRTADVLIVLLESDEKIKKLKGKSRPINSQLDRAKMLASLKMVDYVVLLPQIWTNDQYDDIIVQIDPAYLATTEGDPNRAHKERQASKIGASVVDVIQPILNQSTSKIAALLSEEL